MKMNVLSRIGILAFASLLMLTSCKKDAPDNDSSAGAPKYLVKDVITDSETMKIEYDSQNRVLKLVYNNPYDSNNYEEVFRYEGNSVKVSEKGMEQKGIVERGIVFRYSVASEKELPPASSVSHETGYGEYFYIEGSAKFSTEGKLISYDTFMFDYNKRKFEKITYNLTWKDGNLIAISSSQGVETYEYSDTPNLFNYFDGLAVYYVLNKTPFPSLSASAALHSKNLPKRYMEEGNDFSFDYELDNLGRPILVKIKGKDGSGSYTTIVTTFKY